MKLSVKALAFAAAVLNALCFLFVSIMNLIWPGYGGFYLRVLASLYPGYDATTGSIGIVIGTLYALLAGAVSGMLLAWLYNCITER